MIETTNDGLQGLRASVGVWKRKNARTLAFNQMGIMSCPLCLCFHNEPSCKNMNGDVCPIEQYTGYGQCNETPYGEVYKALNARITTEKEYEEAVTHLQKCIDLEIAFLEEVLTNVTVPEKEND